MDLRELLTKFAPDMEQGKTAFQLIPATGSSFEMSFTGNSGDIQYRVIRRTTKNDWHKMKLLNFRGYKVLKIECKKRFLNPVLKIYTE